MLRFEQGAAVLEVTTKDPVRRRHECVEKARAARRAGARVFQVYLRLTDVSPEEERRLLVPALAEEGWRLDDVGYVGEPPRDSFYGVIAPSGTTVAAIYTFRAGFDSVARNPEHPSR